MLEKAISKAGRLKPQTHLNPIFERELELFELACVMLLCVMTFVEQEVFLFEPRG